MTDSDNEFTDSGHSLTSLVDATIEHMGGAKYLGAVVGSKVIKAGGTAIALYFVPEGTSETVEGVVSGTAFFTLSVAGYWACYVPIHWNDVYKDDFMETFNGTLDRVGIESRALYEGTKRVVSKVWQDMKRLYPVYGPILAGLSALYGASRSYGHSLSSAIMDELWSGPYGEVIGDAVAEAIPFLVFTYLVTKIGGDLNSLLRRPDSEGKSMWQLYSEMSRRPHYDG